MTNNPVVEKKYKHNAELIVENFILLCQLALHNCKQLHTLGDLIPIAKILHKNDKMLAYISGYCKTNNLEHLLNGDIRENLFFERMSIFNTKFQHATEESIDEVIDAFRDLMEVLPYYRDNLKITQEKLKKYEYLDLKDPL